MVTTAYFSSLCTACINKSITCDDLRMRQIGHPPGVVVHRKCMASCAFNNPLLPARIHSRTVANVVVGGFFNFGILRERLMQDPNAVDVREEEQTAGIVARNCSYAGEFAGDL